MNDDLPFGFHDSLHGCRVGEAAHPGPCRCAIFNPTAILRKVGDLLELKADFYCLSETSATTITQQQVSKCLFQANYRCFWSPPVASQFETIDKRPSLRGEALGTAIFSRFHARLPRVTIPDSLTNSIRFNCCIIQLQRRDVLVVSIYGFPGATRCQNNVRMNDLLLSAVWDVIQHVGLPFIVAGDFNEKPQSLPIFEAFRRLGAIEVHQWFENKFGHQLPATCRNATRNDTAILHPWVSQYLVSADVLTSHQIGDHSPLILDFNFDIPNENGFSWRLPQCWARFAPAPDKIAFHYHQLKHLYAHNPICSSNDVTDALTQWSSHIEHAIDSAFKELHHHDPVRHPWNGLPKKFKGRCQPPKCNDNAPPTSVGGDRPGGYNPPCEIFSTTPKLKVKQVRRLTSLMRSIKACSNDNPQRTADLIQEWKTILQAKGYGKTWEKWILGFEAMPFVPLGLPDLDILDTAIAITRVDCDHACQHEYTIRKKSFQYRMTLDKHQDFSKLTYRLMKEIKTPFLQEVPGSIECTATLCRSTKGRSCLKLQGNSIPDFTLQAHASFGSAQICVLAQWNDLIQFRIISGDLPTRGTIVQNYTACTDKQIFSEFNKFWSPYWLRDPVEDQFCDECCTDFIQEMHLANLPDFPAIDINLRDVSLWKKAIADLKPGKAIGICAWRHEELQCLPEVCIQRLADIFHDAQDFALDGFMMQSRTILLPKCDHPESMNQIRPITIISSLFRLYGKVVFQAVTRSWKHTIPWNIMGGLPGKGVKDLALHQKLLIEEHVKDKKQLGGFSLDLVKAFNTFNRRIMFLALTRMGVPIRIASFWIRCLSRLLRHPEIHGRLGPPLPSTTGAPEGDCISVLAMIALSTVFYYRLRVAAPVVQPFAYADNWSWITDHQKSHFKAMVGILNLCHALKVTINFQKSWHWGTTKAFRDFSQILQLLFPSEQDTIVTQAHVKDLGESVAYGKFMPVDVIRARIEVACYRIRRLRWLPCSIQDKCMKIQTAAWPTALYAADTTFVGQKHFQDLRKAVIHAIVGPRNFANAWLAVAALSSHLMDPFLYVLCNMARLIRRLHTRDPALATKFLSMACLFQGIKPFGPASSFQRYCQIVNWKLMNDGTLMCSDTLSCHLFNDPLSSILKTMKLAWSSVLIDNLDRKGVGDYIPNLEINHKVFQAFSDDDQKLLSFYFLGSFQVNCIKHKWNPDQTPDCPLCGAPDTRPHRYLECPALTPARNQFPDAVALLQSERPEWMYIPLARMSDDFEAVRLLKNNLPYADDVKPAPSNDDRVYLFTDGGAIHPKYDAARLASWAVVQDTANNVQTRRSSADFAFTMPPKFPVMKTIAVGLVPGPQSAGRGELYAMVIAIRAAMQIPEHVLVTFVTDAQYVILTIRKIEALGFSWVSHKTPHADLIYEIYLRWNPVRFTVEKIKSHMNLNHARDFQQLHFMIGNKCADMAASSSLHNAPSALLQFCQEQKSWYVREKAWLLEVCRFVLALNRLRISQIDELPQTDDSTQSQTEEAHVPMHPRLYGEEAFQSLEEYNPPHFDFICSHFPNPDLQTCQAFLQGATTAMALCIWAKSLKWPPDLDSKYLNSNDWGITWVELYINFLLTTGIHMPIKTGGTGYNIRFIEFLSDEAMLLPRSRRSLAMQTTSFQRAISALNSLTNIGWFPTFDSGRVTSLKHLGWQVQATGIPCRPSMLRQKETMQFIRKLVPRSHTKGNISDHVVTSDLQPLLLFDAIPDVSMKEKWNLYHGLRRALRQNADGDS